MKPPASSSLSWATATTDAATRASFDDNRVDGLEQGDAAACDGGAFWPTFEEGPNAPAPSRETLPSAEAPGRASGYVQSGQATVEEKRGDI